MSSVSRKCLDIGRYRYKYKPKIRKIIRKVENVNKKNNQEFFGILIKCVKLNQKIAVLLNSTNNVCLIVNCIFYIVLSH